MDYIIFLTPLGFLFGMLLYRIVFKWFISMNKTELTTEDLSKAIQFMKDHCIGSDEITLDRLMGWIKRPLKVKGPERKSVELEPIEIKYEDIVND